MVAATRAVIRRFLLPRQLHPNAWWGYALGIAVAGSVASNPLFLLGLIAAVCLVTFSRRGANPWARSFRLYLWLAVFVIVVRIGFRVLFGGGDGQTILFVLPEIPLPYWVQGIRLLGPVSLESLLAGFYDGARLATVIVCFGAANSLANPRKLLASMPAALYELSTVLIVAVSALPQLGESLQRVMRARRLRAPAPVKGRRQRLRAVETIIVPVLSDALERSLSLAASMDVRGYGRSATATHATGRWARSRVLSILLLGGWAYRFVSASRDVTVLGVPVLSTALLVAGGGAAVSALRLAGRTVRRTQYRPIRWRAAETLALVSGVLPAATTGWIATYGDASVLFPSVNPFQWPTLDLLLLAVLAVAALPAFLTPPPNARRSA
ncbi:energy-coupling factor transporter transmembrane protein EcfT [Tessaracoccus sp. HDW20]|nr:energy-coupling factor transporter transmembrane protein EcfT [Tessaracoccus coleopterorum]